MNHLLTKVLWISALYFVFSHGALAQQQKYALVIGVQNYVSVPTLRHSLNDARDMATVLKSKGFQVETLLDPKSKKEIKDAITRYFVSMRERNNVVGIIYYAGHGTQFEGENYLIPAGAVLQVPGDMDEQCVKMNTVMSVLNSSDNLNILLLDACRTNAFPSFSRDVVKGLTNVEAPKGSIVVFATQPGTVASDGTGKNGLFTSKLLKYINEPNMNIGDVLKKVKQDVNAESEGKQLPSVVDNSLGGDFFFTPGSSTTITTQPITQPIVKTEPAYVAPVTTALDYGYGTADARTVNVGTQEWLGKNLNVDHFANGDMIPEAKTDEEWKRAGENKQPAWCYYNTDPANGRTYGRLYNWYAVNDPRGLAPNGWHVPNDAEWTAITSYLGGEATANTSLKSTYGWESNGNGNNSSGIAGLPGGGRYTSGTFFYLGKNCGWWSSSESSTGRAWSRLLAYDGGLVNRLHYDESYGYSVRCLRD